jgi:hypothetical protein
VDDNIAIELVSTHMTSFDSRDFTLLSQNNFPKPVNRLSSINIVNEILEFDKEDLSI